MMRKELFILLMVLSTLSVFALDTSDIQMNLFPNNASTNVEYYGGVSGSGNNTNYSLSFDGTDDYALVNSPVLSNNSVYSVSVWVKNDDFASTKVALSGNGVSTSRYPDIVLTTEGAILFGNNDNNVRASTANGFVTAGEWYHVVGISRGTTISLYVNGVSIDNSTNSNLGFFSSKLRLGMRGDATLPFSGDISDLNIFDKELTSSEISDMYLSGRNAPIDTTADFYLDGSQLTDLSSNGNNVEAYGGVISTNDNSFSFDGSNDFIKETSYSGNTNGMSYSFWVYFDTVSTQQDIIMSNNANSFGCRMKDSNDGGVNGRLTCRVSANFLRINGLTTGVWYNVVHTLESGNNNVYLNGVLTSSDSATHSADFIGIIAGQYLSGSNNLDGKLSNVLLFDKSLSSTEVTEIYNNGRTYEYFPAVEPTPVVTYPYEKIQSISQTGELSIQSTSYQTIVSGSFDLDSETEVYGTASLNVRYQSNSQPNVECAIFFNNTNYNSNLSQSPIYTLAYGVMALSSDQVTLPAGNYDLELKCRGDTATQFDVLNSNVELHELIDSADFNFTSGFEDLNSDFNNANLEYNDYALFLTSDINLTDTNLTRYLVLESATQLSYDGAQTMVGQASFHVDPSNKTYCPTFERYGGNNAVGNAGYFCVYEDVGQNQIVNISNYFKGDGQLGGKSHLKELLLNEYEFEQTFFSETNLDSQDWTTLESHSITVDSSDKDIYSVSTISMESLNNQVVGEFRFLLGSDVNGSKIYRTVQNPNQAGVLGFQTLFSDLTVGSYEVKLQYRVSPGYFGSLDNISIINSTFVSYTAGQSDLTPNSFYVTAKDSLTDESLTTFSVRDGITVDTTTGTAEIFRTGLINFTVLSDYYYNTTVLNHNSAGDIEVSMIPYPLINFTATSLVDSSSIENFTVTCNGEVVQTATGTNLLYRTKSDLNASDVTCTFDHPDYALTTFNVTALNTSSINTYDIEAYTTNSVTIYFRDEETKNIITQNVTIELIGTTVSYTNSTTTGSIYFDLINPESYTLRYNADGYNQNFFSFTMVNDTTSNITLYMTNSTSTETVTATVVDEKSAVVEGVRIKTFVEDPANPTEYLLSSICDTNFEGVCEIDLIIGTKQYYFILEYPIGTTKKITNPTYIYDTSLSFNIVIGDLAGSEYDFYKEIYTDMNLTSSNTTNSVVFDWNDGNNLAVKGCIQIWATNVLGSTMESETCSNGISGTATKSFTPVNGTTYDIKGVLYFGSDYKVFEVITKSYESENPNTSKNGAFMVVFLLLFFGILLATKPSLLLWFAPLPITLSKMIGIINLDWGVIIGLHFVFAALAYLISDRG